MPSQTPILEVSHLPSASSFYAAITQPLGLQYLYASSSSSPIACLHYGTVSESGKHIVFSIAQANTRRIVPSNICLDAPSSKALVDFHKKSEFLNTEWKQHSIERLEDQGIEYLIAQIADLDGNMIQAAHSQRAPSMAGSQAGSRVLDWQEDVARSVVSGDGRSQVSSSTVTRGPPGTSFQRSQTAPTPSTSSGSRMLERQTITTESYRRQHPERPEVMGRSVSQSAVPVAAEKGISSKAVIGTLLGAAAGAVFAYAMVRSESPEPVAHAPMPVPEAPLRGVSYVHGTSPSRAPSMAESYHREHNVVERIPARSYVSEREGSSQADVRPRYVERYSVVGGQGERGLERIDEGSYVSGSGYSKVTTRPLEIMPAGASSQVSTGSKRSKHHSSHHSSHHSAHESVVSGSHANSQRDDTSYHSARSSRTESTIVPANYVTAAPSKVGSSTTTIKVSPSKVGSKAGSVRPTQVELPRSVVDGSRAAGSRSGGSRVEGSRSGGSRVGGSRTGSVRASQVELPQSVVDEEGYGGYEYEASVAPSDSVSSVGSKMERLRLVGRMGRFTG